MNIIALNQVSRAFHKTERVLENLDLNIEQGEIVGQNNSEPVAHGHAAATKR